MSSGRPNKKNKKKHKSNRQVEALKQTVQSSPVRTELSPYNRDYVDLLPATVLKNPNHAPVAGLRQQAAAQVAQKIKPVQAFAPHLVIAKAVTAVMNRRIPRTKGFNWAKLIGAGVMVALFAVVGIKWNQPIKETSILAYERVSAFASDMSSNVASKLGGGRSEMPVVKANAAPTPKKKIQSASATKKSVAKANKSSVKPKSKVKSSRPKSAEQSKRR
jgi:hypothetical protein